MKLVSNAVKKYCISVFVFLLVDVNICAAVDSGNCDKFFKYVKNFGVWCGTLSVPIPQSGLPLKVKLELSLRGLLKSKYAGIIELTERPEELFEKIIDDRVKTVEYNVLFPTPFPLPVASSIRVNGNELCKTDNVTGSVITTINLEHEFPTNYQIINSDYIKEYYESVKYDCGEYVSRDNVEKVEPGEDWPWLAAVLFRDSSKSYKFLCTGTVLSHLFVLTAAHCFISDYKINPTNIVLYFGKHDLSIWGEKHSLIAKIKKVHTHPQFNYSSLSSDLALIQLLKPIEFTKFIQPLCLWHGHPGLGQIVGKKGLLVGWGYKIDKIHPTPRMVEFPIVDQEECLRSQVDFHYITSYRTFCAGKRNGKGPCNGDSGSALIYPNYEKGSNYWHLRGIVSLALYDKTKQSCDLNQYAVFTDVAKYMLWVTTVLKSQK